MQLTGTLVDLHQRRLYPAEITVENGKITGITEIPSSARSTMHYLLPGFVDAHVHVESSMLPPAEFARLAMVHGTVATVSDPHEIANVLGVSGVEYMVESARRSPFNFCFGAPPCVPATNFETAGAVVTPDDVEFLLQNYPEIGYLAEVMNFPGVLHGDPDMLAKIAVARRLGKPVDGHAPGLRGDDVRRYAAAGIQTDHECFTAEEALDKLAAGMKILIREGSAARNFEALIGLLPEHFENLMFCSDDKHPDSLAEGHINQLVQRALARFPDHLFEILQMACLNPVRHYNLPVGLLRVGDPADFIIVDDLKTFNVLQTYLAGELVAERGRCLLPHRPGALVNRFACSEKKVADFAVKSTSNQPVNLRVIEALDGQLITNALMLPAKPDAEGFVIADPENDVLKLAVVNRYADAPPAVAFIRNFGLKRGAIASSVAHDSHNVIAVGADDESLCEAINLIIREKGGVCVVDEGRRDVLPLPIAGLMSNADGYEVARHYARLDQFAKNLGSTLGSPFMTLSFMALLVIPHLKLSDQGLFDGDSFRFTEIELKIES
ncbi:MAG: adenine deaminase [Cytophagaceae bacterium]|nr:adenine deaminase [Cytophagaceae bacterium]